MKIDILTLFPDMFTAFLNESIIGRAIRNKQVEVEVHDIRFYSKDPHKKVDDYGFGGGRGMVLMCQPIFDAVDALKREDTIVILMTPQGKQYKQKDAKILSQCQHLLSICGHYEGFDERIRSIVDIELSIGDFILTGGEIPSMVIDLDLTELIKKLIDGLSLGNQSVVSEADVANYMSSTLSQGVATVADESTETSKGNYLQIAITMQNRQIYCNN